MYKVHTSFSTILLKVTHTVMARKSAQALIKLKNFTPRHLFEPGALLGPGAYYFDKLL